MAPKSEDKDENKPANNAKVGLVAVIALALILAAGVGIVMTKSVSPDANDDAATSEMASTDSASEDASKNTNEETDLAEAEDTDAVNDGDSTVIARVNGEPITREDADAFIAAVPQMQNAPFEEAFPAVRDELVTGAIIDQKAKAADTANDPEVAKRMEQVRQGVIRSVFLENLVKKEMTDEALQDAYNNFKGDQEASAVEQVHAKHILLPTKEEAEAAIARLKDGEDFDKLAQELSTDKASGTNGGDLGWFGKADMVPEFADAAFALNIGEVSSEPVKSQFGYHIIKVEGKRNEPVPSFEEVKPFLEVQLRRKLLEENIAKWRAGADVEFYNLDGSEVEPAAGEMSEPAQVEEEKPAVVDPAEEEGDEALETDSASEE